MSWVKEQWEDWGYAIRLPIPSEEKRIKPVRVVTKTAKEAKGGKDDDENRELKGVTPRRSLRVATRTSRFVTLTPDTKKRLRSKDNVLASVDSPQHNYPSLLTAPNEDPESDPGSPILTTPEKRRRRVQSAQPKHHQTRDPISPNLLAAIERRHSSNIESLPPIEDNILQECWEAAKANFRTALNSQAGEPVELGVHDVVVRLGLESETLLLEEVPIALFFSGVSLADHSLVLDLAKARLEELKRLECLSIETTVLWPNPNLKMGEVLAELQGTSGHVTPMEFVSWYEQKATGSGFIVLVLGIECHSEEFLNHMITVFYHLRSDFKISIGIIATFSTSHQRVEQCFGYLSMLNTISFQYSVMQPAQLGKCFMLHLLSDAKWSFEAPAVERQIIQHLDCFHLSAMRMLEEINLALRLTAERLKATRSAWSQSEINNYSILETQSKALKYRRIGRALAKKFLLSHPKLLAQEDITAVLDCIQKGDREGMGLPWIWQNDDDFKSAISNLQTNFLGNFPQVLTSDHPADVRQKLHVLFSQHPTPKCDVPLVGSRAGSLRQFPIGASETLQALAVLAGAPRKIFPYVKMPPEVAEEAKYSPPVVLFRLLNEEFNEFVPLGTFFTVFEGDRLTSRENGSKDLCACGSCVRKDFCIGLFTLCFLGVLKLPDSISCTRRKLRQKFSISKSAASQSITGDPFLDFALTGRAVKQIFGVPGY